MTLSTLIINIGIVAIILTLLIGFLTKEKKSWVMSFLQNFTGVLFVFSGWVKAIDPMGTAFKMEQYFAEFQSTFEGTWLSFISPLFPLLSEYSIAFSIFMIVFEIILGMMLILGAKPKFTAWAFFLLVLFFTFLTGFTYLTGYVPGDVNFFDFSNWAAYDKNNMKVTDCGCFGDFIKLEPKTSFFKDIALLIPAIYFVLRSKDMHQLFTEKVRNIVLVISTALLIVYCLNNFLWNLPHTDFRPFKNGTNVAEIKAVEDEAMANVRVTHFVMQNKETGEVINVPYDEYMKNFAKYPKDKFETIEQIKTEPSITKTKISDFVIESFDGDVVTDVYLDNEKYHFMLVSYKLKYDVESKMINVIDSVFTQDTIFNDQGKVDSVIVKASTVESTKEVSNYIWHGGLKDDMIEISKFVNEAIQDGHEVSWVVGGIGESQANGLKEEFDLPIEVYTADDILLKTIIRSNPGIVLWHNGSVVYKWHKNKLPKYEVVESQYLN